MRLTEKKQERTLALSNEYGSYTPFPVPFSIIKNTNLPARNPPNCTFEIDDLESDWPYDSSQSPTFDLIHARNIAGCVTDYNRLFTQAFTHLTPGTGYLELQNLQLSQFYADDDTAERAVTAAQWQKLLVRGYEKFGKRLDVEDEWRDGMERAGFVDVVDEMYKVRQPQHHLHPSVAPVFKSHYGKSVSPCPVSCLIIGLCIGSPGPMAQRPTPQTTRLPTIHAAKRSAGIVLACSVYAHFGLDRGRAGCAVDGDEE